MRLPIPSLSRTSARTCERLLRTAVLLALGATAAANAAPDAAALIGRLARQPPATIAFTEVRFSPLLRSPLVVGGILQYTDDGGLSRRVENPYVESTTIRGETVRVERDGESRTFALRRAPELRGFVTGMIGLLTGNGALLDEHFVVVASGDDERWRLDLEPADERLRQRLSNIIVAGAANEPRCFVIVDTQGGTSVMMLGDAGALPLPPPVILAELLGRCTE